MKFTQCLKNNHFVKTKSILSCLFYIFEITVKDINTTVAAQMIPTKSNECQVILSENYQIFDNTL